MWINIKTEAANLAKHNINVTSKNFWPQLYPVVQVGSRTIKTACG